jgi:hypothetical protein
MSTFFAITPPLVLVPSSAIDVTTAVISELRLAIDISAWDEIDIQFDLASIGGGTAVPTLRVDFLTAMRMDLEDEGWDIFNDTPTPDSVVCTVTGGSAGWQNVRLPSASGGGTGKPLLKYLRYRAWFATYGSVPGASFRATALGRTKGS